ncbi:hypothetical protein FHL15_001552 [Xylaria flabelliformis]|uniref:AAA+ ATPase domain-containing protein n=1 Tax=Xylaria flabelliformis TaxID=2512241 RepID=A0A553IC71_9PEZI|nr:hypothetical protein FHL15_001552 [Xylaria flabelliformis]
MSGGWRAGERGHCRRCSTKATHTSQVRTYNTQPNPANTARCVSADPQLAQTQATGVSASQRLSDSASVVVCYLVYLQYCHSSMGVLVTSGGKFAHRRLKSTQDDPYQLGILESSPSSPSTTLPTAEAARASVVWLVCSRHRNGNVMTINPNLRWKAGGARAMRCGGLAYYILSHTHQVVPISPFCPDQSQPFSRNKSDGRLTAEPFLVKMRAAHVPDLYYQRFALKDWISAKRMLSPLSCMTKAISIATYNALRSSDSVFTTLELPSSTPRHLIATRYPPEDAALPHPNIAVSTDYYQSLDDVGPIQEYDRRVAAGRLREDEHQRGIIQSLQHLHDELVHYRSRPVVHPTLESLKPTKSLFGWLSSKNKNSIIQDIPNDLPRGLYLYGDVGSGKTMLMDLFYDTLPSAVKSKTRIHFHNFMQDVHKRLHRMKMEHGNDIDAVPFVAADIAEQANVLCFDEFQCTDVADAMILRRLLESLMSHGVVLVTTSNRHPDELYKNGIQRESFIPAINLLKARLHVINLDSPTDYRKIPRPPSGVYHTPLDSHAASHIEKWLRFLGDSENPEPHPEVQKVWGREIHVPRVSGRCAWFTFQELIGRATGAADYLELVRSYDAFIVSDVPGMTYRERDLARRFITFIDAVYESHAKLVLTTAVPLTQLFVAPDELHHSLKRDGILAKELDNNESVSHAMQHMMEDMDSNIDQLKESNIFSGDEERFAFIRALSRLSEMASKEWVERGMGLEEKGGKKEKDEWAKVRSRQMEDSM